MRFFAKRLTYANVVSSLCLFLLVGGGTAFAATTMIPGDSVGTEQIKKEAVMPGKLSQKTLRFLADQSGPVGQKGEPGQTGPQGVTGTSAGQAPFAIDARAEVEDARISSPSLALSGKTSWTSGPEQVGLIFGGGAVILAKEPGSPERCGVGIAVFDNGTLVGEMYNSTESETFVELGLSLESFVINYRQPGPHTITAAFNGSPECQAGSKVIKASVTVVAL